jgi:predicted transcriptional regulator
MTTQIAATLAPVPDPKAPQTYRERMESLGLNPTELARLAGLSRTTVYKALDGEETKVATRRAIENALAFAGENPADVAAQPGAVQQLPDDGGMIEFEVNVDAIGVRVVVRGAMANAEELEQQAAKLIRDMRTRDQGPDLS